MPAMLTKTRSVAKTATRRAANSNLATRRGAQPSRRSSDVWRR